MLNVGQNAFTPVCYAIANERVLLLFRPLQLLLHEVIRKLIWTAVGMCHPPSTCYIFTSCSRNDDEITHRNGRSHSLKSAKAQYWRLFLFYHTIRVRWSFLYAAWINAMNAKWTNVTLKDQANEKFHLGNKIRVTLPIENAIFSIGQRFANHLRLYLHTHHIHQTIGIRCFGRVRIWDTS